MASYSSLPCHLSDSPMWMRISVRSPSNFSCAMWLPWSTAARRGLLRKGGLATVLPRGTSPGHSTLKPVGQANPGNREQQAHHDACGNIRGGRQPFAVFEHFCCFPPETGKCGISAEEAHRDGHTPVRRNHHTIQGELPDEPKKKAARQVDEQRAVRKGATDAHLYDALQPVASQGAQGSENRDENKAQLCSDPPPAAKQKLLAPRGGQESSSPAVSTGAFIANSIAFDRISPDSVAAPFGSNNRDCGCAIRLQ